MPEIKKLSRYRGGAEERLSWVRKTSSGTQAVFKSSSYSPSSSGGSGGAYGFYRAVNFTSGSTASQYHIDATAATVSTPAPLVIHLHGDGYQEFTNMSGQVTTSVAYDYARVAKSHGGIFVLPRTPDISSQTWYTLASSTTWLVALINDLKSKYNVDTKKIFFSGFSGGAEQITYNIMADHHTLMQGGGAMILGGGGAEGIGFTGTPSATLKANFPLRWFVGEKDVAGATQPATWSARATAEEGEAFYRNAGFRTSITVIPGKAHNDSEPFGPGYLNDVINETNARYGSAAAVKVLSATAASHLTASTVTDKTIPAPATKAGDVVLSIMAVQGTSVSSAALSAYFTQIGSYARPSNPNLRFLVGWRVATSAEPSSYSPTIPSGVSFRADTVVLSNADYTKISSPLFAETSGASHAAPSVSPSTDNGILLSFVSGAGGNTWTPPAGMTELSDLGLISVSPYLTMSTASLATSGRTATGTKAFTPSSGSFAHIVGSIYVGASA